NAHLAKVDAFLARYLVGADPALAGATRAFWQALNTADAKALATTWPAFEAALPGLEEHARGWASRLAAARDLAAQLVEFVEDRL
ncbi:MAG: elongation factor P maturation arginine rhamnosyltransferase EarP, partial [Burkholderiales bacterium]|nr:elongation factor P maturation arginine rhamnosyltransferase EarP [Burkholderiales bacterium]